MTTSQLLASTVASTQDNSAHGEDSLLVRGLGGNAFLDAVMDGVTGHGGQDASNTVTDGLREAAIQSADDVVAALDEANEELFMAGGGRFLMTTASAALYLGGKLNLISIGDSPVYLARNGEIQQLSGRIGGFINVGVAKAVGAAEKLNYHRLEVDIQPGDRLVLATDGVSDNVLTKEIGEFVSQAATPQEAVTRIDETIKQRLKEGHISQLKGIRFRRDDWTLIVRFFG